MIYSKENVILTIYCVIFVERNSNKENNKLFSGNLFGLALSFLYLNKNQTLRI